MSLFIYEVIIGRFNFSGDAKISDSDHLLINFIFILLSGLYGLLIKCILKKWLYILPIFIFCLLEVFVFYRISLPIVIVTNVLIGITYLVTLKKQFNG